MNKMWGFVNVGFVKVSNSINMIASAKMKAQDICHVVIYSLCAKQGYR